MSVPAHLIVRPMRAGEELAFLSVHRSAVRGLAAGDYGMDVIEAWAPVPITDEHLERMKSNPDGEVRFIAEIGQQAVGIGAIVIAKNELRACYVIPEASRMGVGSAIVMAIEQAAQSHGLKFLQLESSLTAEPFYRSLGYGVSARGEHIFRGGKRMAAVKMHKAFLLLPNVS